MSNKSMRDLVNIINESWIDDLSSADLANLAGPKSPKCPHCEEGQIDTDVMMCTDCDAYNETPYEMEAISEQQHTTVLVDGNVTLSGFSQGSTSDVYDAIADGFGSSEGSEDYDVDVKSIPVTVELDVYGNLHEDEFTVVSVTGDGINFVPAEGYTMQEALGIDAQDLVGLEEGMEDTLEEAIGKLNDAGEIEMTTANYSKIHSDYKTKIDDTYMAMQIDPKTGATALFPVKFVKSQYESTDEASIEEAAGEFSEPMYVLADELGLETNPLLDALIYWMDAQEIETFVSDFRREYDMDQDMNEAAGEFAEPIYTLQDELGLEDNLLVDEITRSMTGDDITAFVSNFRQDHEMNDHFEESTEEQIKESPTMDTTQLITIMKNAGLSEEAIATKITEWANSPKDAAETESTSHGDAYDYAQGVNLSLKRYLDAEDMKVSVTEHTVDNMKKLYEASKNKPDFLDLDDDGDTDEDMKDAVKEEVACSVCDSDPCGCDDTLEEAQSQAQKDAFAKMLSGKKGSSDDSEEEKSDEDETLEEAGMPSSVIKHKQSIAAMTDGEFASSYASKSDDTLRSMAWRHGYGKDSSHYVDRKNNATAESTVVEDATADVTIRMNRDASGSGHLLSLTQEQDTAMKAALANHERSDYELAEFIEDINDRDTKYSASITITMDDISFALYAANGQLRLGAGGSLSSGKIVSNYVSIRDLTTAISSAPIK